MSKTIDTKVVEMKFDNKNFETNVSTTMSTLDKFKQKLNLTGASKGLENLKTQSEKVNFNGMTSAISNIQSKFSALEIIGVTALVNITNSAVEAGKRMVKALTITPISDGFREYEMMMGAIQTTMAGTGKTAEQVEEQLKRLDDYADKTIYSTADMLNNLPKFTNAGVELEKATTAMIGISNATALAGGDANKASIAFYNLGQAIGTGYLTRMDYNSINNAGIATMEWKKQMVEAAIAAGTLSKAGENLYKAGGKTFTLQQLFIDGLQHQWATTDVMMKVFSDYGNQTTEIGKKSWAAAQNIKTFSMMMDSLKATAGTGWKDTWQIIFGGLEPATKMWTGLNNFLSKIIEGLADWRNNLLEGAFGKSFKGLSEGIKSILKPVQKASDSIKEMTKTAKDYARVVDDIILGKYKNAPVRYQLLTEAGYDWAHAQNLVNERLGSSVRHATNYKEAQEEVVKTQEDLNQSNKDFIAQLVKMSDAELRSKGYTEENIKSLRELESLANKLGMSIGDLLDNIDQMDGRWIFLDSFKNFGEAITTIFNSIRTAWKDVFTGDASEGLFNVIAGFHKFSELLKNNVNNNAEALTRTLRGVFSILGFISDIVSGGLKIGLGIIRGILSVFNMNLFQLTAGIGDVIYNTRKWIKEHSILGKALEAFGYIIGQAIKSFNGWIRNNETIQKGIAIITERLSSMRESFSKWVDGLKESDNIPKYILQGLANGIKNGSKTVFESFITLAKGIIETFKSMFRIASPSKVFFAIGGFIIMGLVAGLQSQSGSLWEFITNMGNGIINFFKNLNVGDVIAIGVTGGIIMMVNKTLGIIQTVVNPLKSLNNVFNSLAGMLYDFGNAAEAFGKKMKYEGVAAIIKSVGITIAILAASLVVLGKLPFEQLKQGGIALGIMVGVLALFVAGLALMSKRLSTLKLPDMGKTLAVVIGAAIGISIMASALKKIGKIPSDQIGTAIAGFTVCIIGMGVLLGVLGGISKLLKGTKNISKLGNVFLKMGATMLIVAVALKMVKNVSPDQIDTMRNIFIGFGALLGAIALINKFTGGSVLKAGQTIKTVSTSILLLVFAMKLSGMLKQKDFENGIGVIGVFLGFVSALMLISKIFKGTEMIKVSGSLLVIVAAIGGLALIMRLLSGMQPDAIKKGLVCVTGLSAMMAILIAVSKDTSSGHGLTLLGMGAMILAMSGTVVLLGMMDPEKVKNGILAVGALSVFVGILTKCADGIKAGKNAKATLIMLTVMIGILSVAAVALSFIEPKRLLSSATALGEVMLSLGALVAAAGHMKIAKGTIGTLVLLTAIVGALSFIISKLSEVPNPSGAIQSATGVSILMGALGLMTYALNKFDQRKKINFKGILQIASLIPIIIGLGVALSIAGISGNALQNALAITVLLGAMTGVLAALSLITKFANIGNMAIGIVGLTAMIVPMIAFIFALKQMNDIQSVMPNVLALTILMTAMTGLLAVVSLVGALSLSLMGLNIVVGILGLTAMAIPMLAFIQVLKSMSGIENAFSNAMLLTVFMGALTDMLVKISVVAPLALIADAALLGLVGVIATIGVLATGVGALMETFPQLQGFLDKGLPVLEQIALGIGKIMGNIVGGFLEGTTSTLPQIGKKLSEFMLNAMPFIMIAQTIDDRLGQGVGHLSKALLSLIGANVLDGISQILTNGESFSRLGIELSNFVNNALPFITTMNSIDPNIMVGAKAMADAILALTAGNLLNQITGWLKGDQDLGAFASTLGTLGTGIVDFSNKLSEGGFSQDKIPLVQAASEALKILSEAAKEIPATDGLWQMLAGNVDIESFASKLPSVGEGVVKFVKTLVEGGFKNDHIQVVKSACEALKCLADVSKAIPAQDGFWQWLSGKQDLEDFAKKFPEVAKGIMGFVNGLKEFPNDAVDRVNAACNVMWAIKDLAGIDLNSLSSNVEQLGARLVSFAGKLGEFGGKMNDISVESLETAKAKIQQIIDIASNMSNFNTDSLESFSNSLSKFGKESIQNFVNALNDAKPKSDAQNVIKDILNKVLEAFESKRGDLENKCKSLMDSAVNALKDSGAISGAEGAGKNFVEGFARGIRNNTYLARDAGSSVGSRALEAAKKAIDAHSPSREAYKLGEFFDQGLVNGIKSLGQKVYSTSYDVGERAKRGLSKAIQRVSDLMSMDMDSQPTIRPVLDLSEVQAGANSIGSMFNGQSLAVASNIGAISYSMSKNRQNGNEDVVSAIDDLRKDISNIKGDTYQVGDVSYDDGSNVSESVRSLVRAVRVERRK